MVNYGCIRVTGLWKEGYLFIHKKILHALKDVLNHYYEGKACFNCQKIAVVKAY